MGEGRKLWNAAEESQQRYPQPGGRVLTVYEAAKKLDPERGTMAVASFMRKLTRTGERTAARQAAAAATAVVTEDEEAAGSGEAGPSE